MKRFVLAVLLTLACVWGPVGGGAGAGADPPDSAGWWWKPQTLPLVAVPPPPTVPVGGLYVAGDPTGPFGVSAVRLALPENSVVGTLVLRVASAQGVVAMRACPTVIPWAPEQGGALAGAPAAECTTGFAFGVHDSAAGTVTFEVSPLVRDSVLNIVLTPQDGAVFQASFQPPGADAITVTPLPTSPADPGPSPAYEDSYLEGPAFSDPLVVNAPPPFEPGYAPVVVAPSTTIAPRRVPIVLVPRQAQPASKSGGKDRDSLIASAVFTSLLGLFWMLLSQPSRTPRRLGGLAGAGAGGEAGPVEPARGVGRFRRPRAGPVPRL